MSYDMHELIDFQATIGNSRHVMHEVFISRAQSLRTMAINTIFTDTETVSVENRM